MAECKKLPLDESASISSLDFKTQFEHFWMCIPHRTTLIITGYVILVINLTFAAFLIPMNLLMMSHNSIKHSSFEHYSLEFILTNASRFDLDFPSYREHFPPYNAIVIFGAVKCIIIALNIGCMVGIHRNKFGPVNLINGLHIIRLIYATYSIVTQYVFNELQVFTMTMKAIEFGLAIYFAVLYAAYAKKHKNERLARNAAYTIEQIYFNSVPIEKVKC